MDLESWIVRADREGGSWIVRADRVSAVEPQNPIPILDRDFGKRFQLWIGIVHREGGIQDP